MKVLQKKVCILGDFGVGKTSLVGRFVKNEFSEKYLTTVGVKMDTKLIEVNANTAIKMVIWDIAGDSELTPKVKSYLRGTTGFIFVVDSTRHRTFASFLQLKKDADELLGEIPFVLLLNKHDLIENWDIPEEELIQLTLKGWTHFCSSAKTGENVEQAFYLLAQQMED
jgi:small GTP-binding protein